MKRTTTIRLGSILVVLALAIIPLSAQENLTEVAEDAESLNVTKGTGEWVVAPIPVVNPTIGAGLAGVAMYLYSMDEGSQPSFTGVGAMYTDSKSWGAGIAQVLNFADDAWRLKGGGGYFNLNIDFFGIGNEEGDRDISIPINQKGWGAGVRGLHRVKGHWYGGLQYWYLSIDSSIDIDWTPPDPGIPRPYGLGIKSAVAGLGLVGEYDSRDSQFNPYKGTLFTLKWNESASWLGSDFRFSSADVVYNRYLSVGDQKVLALRGTGCWTPGDTPFYALCKFGQGGDLRGYIGGQYRDQVMFTAQAEFRWQFYKRWGMVAFAGFGGIDEDLGGFDFTNPLPSVGAGLRFMLSEKNRLNLSVDYAVGKDSDAWYFSVGESF
jgi:hypothetical protein